MLFTAENILLVGSILLFVSIIVGKTGYRFGVPALLLFLVVGMLFGSDGLGLQFHNAKEAQFIGMVALSIILFSGGMDTKFTEIKPILSPGIVLSTFGVLLTALFTGLFIWWLSGMSWTNIHLPLITSLLLASTMSSTDSASVFAILRSQKMNLKHNLRPMLELESGSNDPMAYMLTIVLIQFIQSSGMGVSQIALSFVIQFIVGAAAGYLLGKLAILMLNKLNIDNQSLYPILTDMAFPNNHVPLSRPAGQPARNARGGLRGIAHRRIYDCDRTSSQRIPLPASIRETHQYEIQVLRFVGGTARCGSHYLRHLSGGGGCARRGCNLQYRVLHHDSVPRHSRYYRFKSSVYAGTFHPDGKDG